MATIEKDAYFAEYLLNDERRDLPSEAYVPRTMPHTLTAVDMTGSYIIGVFFLSNAAYAATGGSISLFYLLIGVVVFLVPCAVATAQLGILFPFAGSLYNWTHKALGGFWSFFVSICFWLRGVLIILIGANTFVTFAQGLNIKLFAETWQEGLMTLLLLAVIACLSTLPMRAIQNIVNVFAFLLLGVALLFMLSTILWLAQGHPSMTNFAAPVGVRPTNFRLFSIIIMSCTGTSNPLNMAGELIGGARTHRRIVGRYLVWGTIIVVLCYLSAIVALLVVRGPAMFSAQILVFELVKVIDVCLGKWVGNLVVIVILGASLMKSLYYAYASGRILMVTAVDMRIPMQLALLNKHRVPARASLVQVGIAAAVTVIVFFIIPFFQMFGSPQDIVTRFFVVSAASVGLIWAIATSFLFVNLVVLFVNKRKLLMQKLVVPLPVFWICNVLGLAACLLAICNLLASSWVPTLMSNITWSYSVGGFTVICLIVAISASLIANGEAYWQVLNGS